MLTAQAAVIADLKAENADLKAKVAHLEVKVERLNKQLETHLAYEVIDSDRMVRHAQQVNA